MSFDNFLYPFHQVVQISFLFHHKVNSSWCIGILIVVRYFVGSPLSGERTKSSHVVPLPFQMIINGGPELPAIDSTEMNDTTPQGSIWILTGRIQKSYPSLDVARKKAFHWHIEGNTKCWYRAMWGLKYIKLQTLCAGSLNYCIEHLLSTAFESVLYLFYKKSQYTDFWSELAAQMTTFRDCQDMGKITLTWLLEECQQYLGTCSSAVIPCSLLCTCTQTSVFCEPSLHV